MPTVQFSSPEPLRSVLEIWNGGLLIGWNVAFEIETSIGALYKESVPATELDDPGEYDS